MAQEGKRSSFPASFFEIDEFDAHWDEDESTDERPRSSARQADPPSEIHATGEVAFDGPAIEIGTGSIPPLDSEEDAPSGEFAVGARVSEFDFELPLIHGSNVPVAAPARPQPEPSAPPPTVRPGKGKRTPDPPPAEEAARDALDLSEADEGSRPTFPDDPLLSEVRDLYATGDYSGALVIAEGLLQTEPHHTLASRYAEHCRHVLEQMAASRLGPLDQVPRVAVESDRLRWLSLDHRAGFLLSLVDGTLSIEELLDISGMPRFEALRILCDLLDQNVISLA